jgi:hypothetical protein
MAKRHRSFADIRDEAYGHLAAPSASHRVDQRVAGNENVFREAMEKTANAPRKSGGCTEARKHLASKQIALHGVSPAIRQDKPSRRARGGRSKHEGLGHLLIVALPHPGMLGAPMARRGDAGPKGEHKHERHGSPGAGSYKRGGVVDDHRREV